MCCAYFVLSLFIYFALFICFVCLFVWLVGWLVGWFVGWLVGWLVGSIRDSKSALQGLRVGKYSFSP